MLAVPFKVGDWYGEIDGNGHYRLRLDYGPEMIAFAKQFPAVNFDLNFTVHFDSRDALCGFSKWHSREGVVALCEIPTPETRTQYVQLSKIFRDKFWSLFESKEVAHA